MYFSGSGTCNVFNCDGGHTISGSYNTILGGCCHCISFSNVTCTGSIFGGFTNKINAAEGSAIGAGAYNVICNTSTSVIGGIFNSVCNGGGSTFIVGNSNTSTGGNAVSIWGQFNSNSSNYSATLGQYLTGSAYYTTIQDFQKLGGSFAIPHPDPAKRKYKTLWHSFVESPTEGDNIYRFNICAQNCSATLCLPEYYKFLNKNDQVLVTPKNHFGTAFGIVDDTQSCVNFTTNQDGEYDVLIIGTRKDYDATFFYRGNEHYNKVININ